MKLPRLHALLALALAGSALLATPAAAQPAASLPSPEKFFGFKMGADRKLANWDKLHEYYQTLAKSSNRVKLVEVGKSSEGRPYIALFISSPANLAKLEQIRQINAKLADPRGISAADSEKLIADGKAVIVQTFALHSSEVAAAQTAAEFVYDSLTRTDEDGMRALDNVISIVMPSINPDGTQMIGDWYMKYAGTPNEASNLPWLYQKYAGHDNNRDGFALNLPESQNLAKILYRDWMPQAYMDHHQMGSGNARISIPPYAEPIRPGGDPLVWREMLWYGGDMATKLEAAGRTGVASGAIYSGWGHMGFHWITPFHNIAGMLAESASARLATPMYIHPDQLRGGPRGIPTYDEQVNMPSLWPGGWWTVRDIVENQKIVAWSMVDLAAKNRVQLLRNMYLKGTRQTERGAAAAVKAYVIAAQQHDASISRKLANMLLDSGVEVHQAKSQFFADGKVFGAGSYVVSMAQPKQALVRYMMGRTFYPDNSYTRDKDDNPIAPYDMAADVFAEFMGIRVEPVGEKINASDLTKLTTKVSTAGSVASAAPNGYVLDGRQNDSYRAVNLLLDKGVAVRRVSTASPDGSVRPGDFLVGAGDHGAIATQSGATFAALKAAVASGAYDLKKQRIGLFQRYGGGNMDEGWTRLMFEQFNVPFKSVMDAELKAGDLNSKYDVIVLPADSVFQMTGDRPTGGGPGGGGGFGGGFGGNQNTPAEYRSGFGNEGVKGLQDFVRNGGTLVTFAQAGDLAIQRFSLPLRNVVAGVPSKTFWCPGSTLRARFNNDRPLVYGMPSEGLALFMSGSQVYEVTSTESSQDVDILATYADRDLLQSGWLLGEDVIAKKAAAVSVRQGSGRVVLLGFRAQNRDQTHGTFKMVFNALLNGPSVK
jgi:hypothetical protein